MKLYFSYYFKRYKSIIAYAFWGVLTTLVNIGSYLLLYSYLHFSNITSNASAWVVAVLFAFITNRKWVFQSNSVTFLEIFREMFTFFLCRFSTGILDMAFMYITVDLILTPSIPSKVISNVIVILLNYLGSKFFVFRK